jgi:hypothetical protein
MRPCDACAAAKANQKNLPKESNHEPATGSDRRMFLDIATVKKTKTGPSVTKPNWQLMVDERARLKFSDFFQTKNGMIEPTCVQFHQWKLNGMAVTHVRMNGAGENKKLKMRSDSSKWMLNLKFEITACDTPQQNHLVELGFATSHDDASQCASHHLLQSLQGGFQNSNLLGWTDVGQDSRQDCDKIHSLLWRKSKVCKSSLHLGRTRDR